MRITSRVVVIFLCLGVRASAADQMIALKAERMFDGKSKTLVQHGVIIVQGDKIVDVGSNLAVPGGAKVIDLGDATLSPGFIDAHTHLTLDYSADYIDGIADGPEEIRKAVRFEVKNGADVIKAAVSGGVLSLADEVDTPQLTPSEMAALVDESHRLRKKVAVHCHGDQAAREAIEAGVDSIEHGSFMKPETLTLMKNKGTFLTPTLMATEWIMSQINNSPPALQAKAKAAAAARSDMFHNAVKIGVKISFGTDAAVFPHGQNAKEFKLMVDLGMTPIDALKSATANDAELLGFSQKVGTLEKGKLDDIVAMPGDPASEIP